MGEVNGQGDLMKREFVTITMAKASIVMLVEGGQQQEEKKRAMGNRASMVLTIAVERIRMTREEASCTRHRSSKG